MNRSLDQIRQTTVYLTLTLNPIFTLKYRRSRCDPKMGLTFGSGPCMTRM
jgi:hypothetical protein